MKKAAILLAASVLVSSAFASTSPTPKKPVQDGGRHWVINVGAFKPTDDLDDAGVDFGWMASADYHFGAPSGSTGNMSWFAGIGAFFGSGDNDFDMNAYGVHLGLLFGFGQPGDENPWGFELKGGLYRANVSGESEIIKAGGSSSFDEDDTGFMASAALTYRMKSGGGGKGLNLALGWFMLPEVSDGNLRGWFFSVGFPVG